MAARALLALAVSVLAASAVEVTREVGPFTGIHVSDSIVVVASNSTDGNSSVTINASAEILRTVRCYVDRWGTLVVSRRKAARGEPKVGVRALVPGPLTYAGAAFEGLLVADTVSGFVLASNGGQVVMKAFEASRPLGIVASSNSSVVVSHGQVPMVAVSCASDSEVHLGQLRANQSMLSISSRSQVTGMTTNSSMITISSYSHLWTTAMEVVGLSCSDSEVGIGGSAQLMTYSSQNCNVHGAPTHAHSGVPSHGHGQAQARTSKLDGLSSGEAPIYP